VGGSHNLRVDAEIGRVHDEPDLLPHLAGGRLGVRLARLGLAAGQVEGVGVVRADDEDPAVPYAHPGRRDDRAAHRASLCGVVSIVDSGEGGR
jgi:hypothetical protein